VKSPQAVTFLGICEAKGETDSQSPISYTNRSPS